MTEELRVMYSLPSRKNFFSVNCAAPETSSHAEKMRLVFSPEESFISLMYREMTSPMLSAFFFAILKWPVLSALCPEKFAIYSFEV